VTAFVLDAAIARGLNVYVLTEHYQVAIETASSAILISTSLAMLTITALLLLLPPVPL
jgi:predicted permease